MPVLAQITRKEVLTRLREMIDSTSNARTYRDEVLPRVEHLNSLVATNPEVLREAERLVTAEDNTQFEIEGATTDSSHEIWSDRLDREESRAVKGYCLLNMAAVVLVTRTRVLEFSPLAEACFAKLEWNVLHHVRGDESAALRVIEDWLGLPKGEYSWVAARECTDRLCE